jgi:hypothetical protein
MNNIQFLELHSTIFLEQKVVILNLVMDNNNDKDWIIQSPSGKLFTSNDN